MAASPIHPSRSRVAAPSNSASHEAILQFESWCSIQICRKLNSRILRFCQQQEVLLPSSHHLLVCIKLDSGISSLFGIATQYKAPLAQRGRCLQIGLVRNLHALKFQAVNRDRTLLVALYAKMGEEITEEFQEDPEDEQFMYAQGTNSSHAGSLPPDNTC
ncbi:hypothetical protein ACP70R_003133 [Stipagrostis hirtigluma subsp. patula]